MMQYLYQTRVQYIFKSLRNNFTECWKVDETNPPNSSFYHEQKSKFGGQTYLHFTKLFTSI